MNKPFVGENKQVLLKQRMLRLGIQDADLTEKFVLGSGKGGQKINKTASCVYLKHVPTGIEMKCQPTRSLAMNRYYARTELCNRFEERILGERSRRIMEQERIRRQKRRRSRRQKQRMLEEKHRHSEKKGLRRPVGFDG